MKRQFILFVVALTILTGGFSLPTKADGPSNSTPVYSQDGKLIAAVTGGSITVSDTGVFKQIAEFKIKGDYLPSKFEENGVVDSVTFNCDNTLLAVALASGNVEIYDIKKRKKVKELQLSDPSTTQHRKIAFSPNYMKQSDRNMLLSMVGNEIKMWDIGKKTVGYTIKGNFYDFTTLGYNEIVTSEQVETESGTGQYQLRKWNLDKGEGFGTFAVDKPYLRITANGLHVAGVIENGVRVKNVFNSPFKETEYNTENNPVHSISLSNCSRFMVTNAHNHRFTIWGLDNNSSHSYNADIKASASVRFNPGNPNQLAYCGDDGKILVLNVVKKEQRYVN